MLNKFLLTILCLLGTAAVFAQTRGQEFGIQTDNDAYLAQGSDRYYTNGLFFYYHKALSTNGSAKLQNKVWGLELGQKMYNPISADIENDPNNIDRPFAAYSYIGSTLNFLYKNEGNLKIGTQIGVVGPAAGGEQAQKFIHKLIGFYPPNGWQYQIKNDVELNLSAEYNKLLARSDGLDVSLASYANLGNGFTGAGVGPLIRLGNFNQLFNSISTQSTASLANDVTLLNKYEIFFYYKPQINVVAYDATIQGSLFNKQTNSNEVTLDKKPLIFSQQVGLAFTTSRFAFDVAAVFHTRDVKEMRWSHQWGSVTGYYRFK